MKKKVLSTVLSVLFPVLAVASAGADVPQRDVPVIAGNAPAQVKKQIKGVLQGTAIQAISRTPIPQLYEITAGSKVLYSGPEGKFLVFGHIYDFAEQKDLTQAKLDSLEGVQDKSAISLAWKDLPLEAAVEFGVPGGKKIAIFSDPDCPYCRKLHYMLDAMKGIHVYEIMFPVKKLHPGAYEKAAAILCSDTPHKRLKEFYTGGELEANASTKCADDKLETALAYGKSVGIPGTPVIVNEKGEVLFGVQTEAKLRNWLGIN